MAMSVQDYEDRIAKNEIKLAKIEKRIQKWEDSKSDENFAKYFEHMKEGVGWAIDWDANGNRVYGTFEQFKELRYPDWEKRCNDEIRYAERDKQDTLITMDKYKNAIALLQEKESKPVIQIFKDFFNNWKQEINEYVKPWVKKYYEVNSKSCDLYNNSWSFEKYGFESRQAMLDESDRLYQQQKQIRRDTFVGIALDKGKDFDKFLDDYMTDRYFELVEKVTKITGEIEDVSRLRVGVDGTLNGIVKGNKGTAKLTTIVAGGYNDDVIVNVKHGQCRHYRVLVHPVKGE